MNRKQTLCFDFDGVLHSYASGWQGATVIPDPPVPGAMAFLAKCVEAFDVCIYSSRSKNLLAQWAMRRWLLLHMTEHFLSTFDEISCEQTPVESPAVWTHQDALEAARDQAEAVVDQIRFPWFKPPAHMTLDDRAWTFSGVFPEVQTIKAFRPWNKR